MSVNSRRATHYIAHSEPLLKQLNLLNMKDMVDQKLLKFLHKLNTNKLPAYFNSYKPYLKRINTTYNLRRNPLPVPAVKHMYAESLLIYRLVKLKNTMSVKFPLVAKKLDEGSHSLAGFSNYVAKTMIDRYEYLCTNDPCVADYNAWIFLFLPVSFYLAYCPEYHNSRLSLFILIYCAL